MKKMAYTIIDNYFVCNDCGASSISMKSIKHHPTCVPGTSQHWEKQYSIPDPNDDEKYVTLEPEC